MSDRLVVIGANAGGMSAASVVRRRCSATEKEILVFELGHYTSYSGCGIPYYVSGLIPEVDDLVVRRPADFAKRDIQVHLAHEVVEIDTAAQVIKLRDLSQGTENSVSFDQLLIATGSRPVRPPIPGIDAENVLGVHTLDDGHRLRRFAGKGAEVVVVGGGYIGLEMAEAYVEQGCHVTLIEAAEQPMGTLDPDMGARVATALERVGVQFHRNTSVEGFVLGQDGCVREVTTSAGSFPADVVVLGMGSRPNTRLARAAGIEVGETGGIVVDAHMQTCVPGIWAAGDCVQSVHRVTGRPIVIGLGTHANKQGRVAGINISGGDAVFSGVLGTAISRICSVEVARTGLTEREADKAGLSYTALTTISRSRPEYFPGADEIVVKTVAEKPTGRLLGAQIVGCAGSGKRIDVFATALWNEMTVGEIAQMDLSYAPPFSPVWDPVAIAARRASERLS